MQIMEKVAMLALVYACLIKFTFGLLDKNGPIKKPHDDNHNSFDRKITTNVDMLFDLSVEPYETTNLADSPEYLEKLGGLSKRSEYWLTQLGQPDEPYSDHKLRTWKNAGGVVPWLSDYSRIEVPTRYSYANAPNIVLFVVDDWGYNDIGYQSTYLSWTTPNINKLASHGVKLTNYYTHELCVPSRAALMTGRYALRYGMHDRIKTNDSELYLNEVTMAEELKSAGYHTNLVGKWHLGMSSLSRTPRYRGFDHFYGYYNGYIDYYTKQYNEYQDLTENVQLVDDTTVLADDIHSSNVFANEAIKVIKNHQIKHKNEPMFLYYASQLMHTNWAADEKYVMQCQAEGVTVAEQTYCGMNLMLDEAVGQIICALEETNMMDNTIFVMISDNGGNEDMRGSNSPFRGSKGSLYRGANTVPGFIVAPQSLLPQERQGGVYEGQMHVTDWLPTFMSLATNNEWSGSLLGNDIDGFNMWESIVTNSATKHTEIVHYMDSQENYAIQLDMLKLIHDVSIQQQPSTALLPNIVFTTQSIDTAVCDSTMSLLKISGSSTTSSVTYLTSSVTSIAHNLAQRDWTILWALLLSLCIIFTVVYVPIALQDMEYKGYEEIPDWRIEDEECNTFSAAASSSASANYHDPAKHTLDLDIL